MQKFAGDDSNAVCDMAQMTKAGFTVTIAKPKKQSVQWVFPFEELPTKVKRSRSIGKKMVASFFGMIRDYAILEGTKRVTADCTKLEGSFKTTISLGESVLFSAPLRVAVKTAASAAGDDSITCACDFRTEFREGAAGIVDR
ncbi:hypothetical protein EVAR_26823_1 [Eumeta japonica]|uniref:Uncharacterized protein n=1 Tax=Eumeta variegata TaxID=151549 RepID=A0A4C1WG34_EUMVA|nr:hypothetical protein EVAR_26823_1 [Eumeta japonica]